MARRWRNRTSHKIVNYPVNGFEAHDVHQKHKPSKSGIIPYRFLFTISLLIFLSGCGFVSDMMTGKNIYDIYGVSVDKRSVYNIAKDRYIITQIQSHIAQNIPSKLLKIDVESFYGHVYIIGEYEKKIHMDRLISYTKSLKNVRKITTYLLDTKKREHCNFSEDVALIAKVKTALLADKGILGTNVHVHVFDCKVILVGIVQNEAIKLRAQAISKHTQGVKESISLLRALH